MTSGELQKHLQALVDQEGLWGAIEALSEVAKEEAAYPELGKAASLALRLAERDLLAIAMRLEAEERA